jgi:hypothetical protein
MEIAMLITTDELVTYATNLDSRISTQSHSIVLKLINNAGKLLSSKATCFYSKDIYPLSYYYKADILKFDVYTSKELIYAYDTSIVDTYTLESVETQVTFTINENKSITVSIPPKYEQALTQSIAISYFYNLDIQAGGHYNIDYEIIDILKELINVEVWKYMKDYNKVEYHQKQTDILLSKRVQGMPPEMSAFEGIKGGFI